MAQQQDKQLGKAFTWQRGEDAYEFPPFGKINALKLRATATDPLAVIDILFDACPGLPTDVTVDEALGIFEGWSGVSAGE